jgi:hypothetical protein
MGLGRRFNVTPVPQGVPNGYVFPWFLRNPGPLRAECCAK